MPVLMMSLTLVHEVPKDGRAAAEPGHLPAEGHGLAITVQERHPVRGGGDSCKEAQRERPQLTGLLCHPTRRPGVPTGGALGTGPASFLGLPLPIIVFYAFFKRI